MNNLEGLCLMLSILPHRYFPAPMESSVGYSVRLAHWNSWSTPTRMFHDMDVGNFKQFLLSSSRLHEALVTLTGHAEEILDNSSSNISLPGFLRDDSRIYKQLDDLKPKVCTACLAEESTIKSDWGFVGLDYCLLHNRPLVTHCKNCKVKLDWHVSLLESKCPKCGDQLKSENTDGRIPEYLVKLKSLTKSQQKDYLADLFLTAQRILRPYDSLFERGERPPIRTDWTELLSNAYRLLTNNENQLHWIKSCTVVRSSLNMLGNYAVNLPISELLINLKLDWSIKTLDYKNIVNFKVLEELPETKVVTRNARKFYSPTNDQLRAQVDIFCMFAVLSVDSNVSAIKLIQMGVIKPLKECRIARDALFDLNDLVIELNELKTKFDSYEGTLISREQYNSLLQYFNATDADVLGWLKAQKLRGRYLDSGFGVLEMFQPGRVSLFRCLSTALNKLKTEEILLKDARKIIGISEADTFLLLQNKLLQTKAHQHKVTVYGNEVVGIIKDWIILPRYCRLNKLNLSKVRIQITEQGYQPFLGNNFFTKTTGLKKLLNQIRFEAAKNTNDSKYDGE